MQKFASRNRVLVGAMLAIGVALFAGIAGTSYGLIQANQKTKLAEDKTQEAEDEHWKAKASEKLALSEKNKAQANEERAMGAEKRPKIHVHELALGVVKVNTIGSL